MLKKVLIVDHAFHNGVLHIGGGDVHALADLGVGFLRNFAGTLQARMLQSQSANTQLDHLVIAGQDEAKSLRARLAQSEQRLIQSQQELADVRLDYRHQVEQLTAERDNLERARAKTNDIAGLQSRLIRCGLPYLRELRLLAICSFRTHDGRGRYLLRSGKQIGDQIPRSSGDAASRNRFLEPVRDILELTWIGGRVLTTHVPKLLRA